MLAQLLALLFTLPARAENRSYSDLARMLAGLPQPEGGSLTRCESDPAWQAFSKQISSEWARLDKKRTAPMRRWASKEVDSPDAEGRTLFYPFSGPDFFSARVFFPKAPRYVLIGLEPVGSLPDISSSSNASPAAYLGSMQESLADLFKRSYFRTVEMRQDLSSEGTGGVLPLLMVFSARSGLEVSDVRAVEISTGGALVERPWEEAAAVPGPAHAVRLELRPKSGPARSLYYFSADLSDFGLKRHPEVLQFVEGLAGADTYLKSASYLMHDAAFSLIRFAILDRSARVLQDDSGIPYREFKKDVWNIQLYGTYERPIDDFPTILEPELEVAYATEKVRQLPFWLGYHWGRRRGTNLLRAERKPTGAPAATSISAPAR